MPFPATWLGQTLETRNTRSRCPAITRPINSSEPYSSAVSISVMPRSMPAAHGCSAAAVALAWTIRGGRVIAIPESGSVSHVKENAVALTLTLTPQELQDLDAAFPPPVDKR